jgi:hypothetical protein
VALLRWVGGFAGPGWNHPGNGVVRAPPSLAEAFAMNASGSRLPCFAGGRACTQIAGRVPQAGPATTWPRRRPVVFGCVTGATGACCVGSGTGRTACRRWRGRRNPSREPDAPRPSAAVAVTRRPAVYASPGPAHRTSPGIPGCAARNGQPGIRGPLRSPTLSGDEGGWLAVFPSSFSGAPGAILVSG